MSQADRANEKDGKMSETRSVQRLADRISVLFYEACRVGSIESARHLMLALECEVARSSRLAVVDTREDGSDIAAIRARLQVELKKQTAAAGKGSQTARF